MGGGEIGGRRKSIQPTLYPKWLYESMVFDGWSTVRGGAANPLLKGRHCNG
jgi:hypothetical protein